MVNFRLAFVLIRLKQFSELSTVAMNVCQVKRSKVLIKRVISQLIVDVKEKGILNVLWRLSVRNPIKFVCTVKKELTGNYFHLFTDFGFFRWALCWTFDWALAGTD